MRKITQSGVYRKGEATKSTSSNGDRLRECRKMDVRTAFCRSLLREADRYLSEVEKIVMEYPRPSPAPLQRLLYGRSLKNLMDEETRNEVEECLRCADMLLSDALDFLTPSHEEQYFSLLKRLSNLQRLLLDRGEHDVIVGVSLEELVIKELKEALGAMEEMERKRCYPRRALAKISSIIESGEAFIKQMGLKGECVDLLHRAQKYWERLKDRL